MRERRAGAGCGATWHGVEVERVGRTQIVSTESEVVVASDAHIRFVI